ncbi:lrr receptor-like serine/threonine-protein kinase efr [Quercus suber]|uniref:Lrr receptor-like serine/threonine-protein kinase efr n=1 Tax=Quercus suber TaxID=58331 RepID=A0AAW0M586_QUESU
MASPSHLILQSTLLIVLILCKCIFLDVESQSATLSIVTDKEALISFKSRIIEPFNPLSSWDQKNSSPCNWTGVVCNKSGQRVVGLDLSGFGLKGSISPHIGNLSFLRSLQLGQNQFTGMLPDQIVNLFHVRVLNLSSNRLEGVLLSNISQLTELQVLDLSENKNITGRIPEELSYLKKLEVLKLAKNHLYGAIPSAIGNLSSLINLNLGTNTLSGAIPSDLGHLQNLKELDLNINNFSGTVPPSIYNISSLVSLALASNNLWGEIPGDVGIKLPNLLVFNFCINKFTGKIPWSLYNLTNIKIIHVADNLLEGTIPPDLGNLPFLEMYDICFNKIVSEDGLSFITSLKNSTRLKFLAIGGNHLEGVIPGSIGNLSKALSKFFGNFQKLLSMDLSNNKFSGKITREIFSLPSLSTVLNLSKNFLSGALPEEVSLLVNVVTIDLSNNLFSGNIPSSIRKTLCFILGSLFYLKRSKSKITRTSELVKGQHQMMLQLMSSLHHNDQPISPDVQHGCLITILGVGLSCTVESSDGRISIRSALQNLKSARDTLLNQLPLRIPN